MMMMIVIFVQRWEAESPSPEPPEGHGDTISSSTERRGLSSSSSPIPDIVGLGEDLPLTPFSDLERVQLHGVRLGRWAGVVLARPAGGREPAIEVTVRELREGKIQLIRAIWCRSSAAMRGYCD
ncbi:hypothetical protein JHW43_009388 [Diplocarpon mali]|nr:hypothetical protein JHW43_009388 [Diplocarpon mali]